MMTNSDYLTMAENRLGSAQRDYPNSSDIDRLLNIVLDMTNKMTPEELAAHNAKKIETPEAKIDRLEEERRILRQMEMNKDRSSI